jgi:hypothetical protein
LTGIYLGGCSSLTTLPKELENLTSLEEMNVGGCLSLKGYPMDLGICFL